MSEIWHATQSVLDNDPGVDFLLMRPLLLGGWEAVFCEYTASYGSHIEVMAAQGDTPPLAVEALLLAYYEEGMDE